MIEASAHRHLLAVPLALVAVAMLAGCACGPAPFADAGGPDGDAVDGGRSCEATFEDFPEPVAGRCRAVLREGATLPAGPEPGGGVIVPGGQRLLRVGTAIEIGSFPMRAIAIPGTRFAVVSDGGKGDEVLAVIDVDAGVVVDREEFLRRDDEALFFGLAVSPDGRQLWASGGGQDVVHAFDVDPATGALTEAPARAVSITASGSSRYAYVSGLALGADGILAVALVREGAIALVDTARSTELARIPLEDGAMPYDVVFAPDGATLFASLWGSSAVAVIDVARRAQIATIPVGKNPQAMALSPDGASLAVACADGDVVAIVDVATRTVAERFYVVGEDAPRGASPVSVRWGPGGRLFVVDALENAIDVLAREGAVWRRIGRIPTLWHPTDVLPFDDGTVVFLNGRHLSTGANVSPQTTDIDDLLRGSASILHPDEYDDARLAAWEDAIASALHRMADLVGVECEPGAAYDFPIPLPGMGPSTRIRHVFLIVRENKTYDAYFGDLRDAAGAPHGNGDPTLVLIPSDRIEDVIPNTRQLARIFALGDNYYSHAEQSLQGHVWTTMGRTNDFVERTWLTSSGRGTWVPPGIGVATVSYPEEGSGFDQLVRAGVEVHNDGEIAGSRSAPPDPRYPGIVYNLYDTDRSRAEHVAALVRDCRVASFHYVLLPRDHTEGLRPGAETPSSMIADNDEGLGSIVEAISHSTYWPESVIFVIEDDPQVGGDHVENHRSGLQVISPWARRGHVSSVHASEASIWRTIQLIFGLPTQSAEWERAAPLYDFFTSSPDYTPYDAIARRWPVELNPDDGSDAARLSADYDWTLPDEQPGLARILWRHFRGTDPPWPEQVDLFDDAFEEHESER